MQHPINNPNATEDDCISFMQQHAEATIQRGGHAMPIEQFWQPGDLQHFNTLQEWWPAYATGFQAKPTLSDTLSNIAGITLPDITFLQTLTLRWQRCCVWLISEGKDTERPNEIAKERRNRQAREGMARTRARKSETTPPAQRQALEQVKHLHAAYIAACQVRKAAAQAAHDLHTPQVDAAKAAWESAKGAS